MKTLNILGFAAILGAMCLNQAFAGETKINNSVLKRVSIEDLSHRGDYRFSMVSQPTRRGESAQRFEIRHGDCGRNNAWNDCINDRGRVEMKERRKNSISKPGREVWYGYSMLIPQNFVSLGRGNTMLGQVKEQTWKSPIWSLTFNDHPYLNFSDNEICKIGSLSTWKGKWVDVTIYAYYGREKRSSYFRLYKNGKLICDRKKPFIPDGIDTGRLRLGLKYGIYNSFLSRYLAAKGVVPDGAGAYQQSHEQGKSNSFSPTPFKYDWGVELPTHVIFYDEFRYGASREEVDVRILEERGIAPVD